MPTLDTSFLIDLIRHKPEALEKVTLFIEAGVPLATTCINLLELYRGAFLSASPNDNVKEVLAIQNALINLTIDDDTYEAFGALSAEQKRNGSHIGDFDELIASIALCNDGMIITRDQHFLHVPGLKVETY